LAEPVAGFLFPEEKVIRFRRIRKFIYQKVDIGNSDCFACDRR